MDEERLTLGSLWQRILMPMFAGVGIAATIDWLTPEGVEVWVALAIGAWAIVWAIRQYRWAKRTFSDFQEKWRYPQHFRGGW